MEAESAERRPMRSALLEDDADGPGSDGMADQELLLPAGSKSQTPSPDRPAWRPGWDRAGREPGGGEETTLARRSPLIEGELNLEQCALLDPNEMVPSAETQEAMREQAKQLGQVALRHSQTGIVLASQYGQTGLSLASQYGQVGFYTLKDYIQQGPRSLSNVCLIGGIGTTITGMLHLAGFADALMTPFKYLLNLYMLIFGITTVVLEADPERMPGLQIAQDIAPHLLNLQKWLHERVQLLTQLHGRAFFYIYQGTLLVTQGCTACLLFLSGIYSVVMGVLCLGMAYEYARQRNDHQPGEETDAEAGDCPGLRVISRPGDTKQVDKELTEQEFARAQVAYGRATRTLKGRTQFELHGLLKQATEGDCVGKRPTGYMNSSAKARYDAWSQLRGMSPFSAKAIFVERLATAGIHI